MYIGLDLGTSGVKGIVIDDEQTLLASATAGLSVQRPQTGWSEQDPGEWIAACETVLAELSKVVAFRQVRGIGLSGHMHGATAIDASDAILWPCILWNDTRSSRQAAEMDADPAFRAITGNIMFPGFTAPKIEWLRQHHPAVFDRIAKVLLPKDHVRLWLTGEHVSDMSDAAGTGWFDTGARDWSRTLLTKCGLARDQMPDLVEGSGVSGTIRGAIATRFGLSGDVVVAGGAGDNAASAIGVGVVNPGEAFVSLGTSGVLFVASERYSPDPQTAVHTFCHAVPGTWHQMGVILAAADALSWYAGIVGKDPGRLTGALGTLRPPGRTLFLPYLGGERTPLNDADIRGAFLGLDHATDADALTRAVLEGVAFATRDCQRALAATGTGFDSVIAVGGGSASDYWTAAIAAALNVRVDLPVAGAFGAALGAARLGLMAATGAGTEIARRPAIARSIEPDAALVDAFAKGHARYTTGRDLISRFARED